MKRNKLLPEKVLKIILIEMCNRVNCDYNSINFKEHNWFMKYEWTEIEQESFKDWMIKLFKENKKYFNTIALFPRISKIEKVVDNFIFNYGWKTKRESNE